MSPSPLSPPQQDPSTFRGSTPEGSQVLNLTTAQLRHHRELAQEDFDRDERRKDNAARRAADRLLLWTLLAASMGLLAVAIGVMLFADNDQNQEWARNVAFGILSAAGGYLGGRASR